MDEHDSPSTTRRDVMRGVGGLAALSMSTTTLARAQEVLESGLEADPHTVDTYRSIVDAIVPRTPDIVEEENEMTGETFGSEHVPGGLEVELEKFIIWEFNHFHEIRAPSIAPAGSAPGDAEMPQSMFEFDLDTTDAGSELDALASLGDGGVGDRETDGDALVEHLDFGATDRVTVEFADLNPDDGVATFDLLVETSEESSHQVVQYYPYANTFPYAFDLVAAEFLACGENEDPPAPNEQFPAGGTFVRLSREDRLRALWTIVDGGAVDRLDDLLSPMFPYVGLLKFVVMAVNGLHGFGYYTEWSGYGDTKTAAPSERELQVEADEVQSRQQSGYPGPSDGYAADWRHPVDGGFSDNWDGGAERPEPPEAPADESPDEADTGNEGAGEAPPEGPPDEEDGGVGGVSL
jgi:hypothetical protein